MRRWPDGAARGREFGCPDDAGQRAVGIDTNDVVVDEAALVPPIGAFAFVRNRDATERGLDIGHQRAAEGNVRHLQAAADAQRRHAAFRVARSRSISRSSRSGSVSSISGERAAP